MKLRDYQEDLVNDVWSKLFNKNRLLVVSPTGSGKTECFIALCDRAIKNKPDIKILILLNKVMLVEQTARRMSKIIPNIGIFCGSLNEKNIQSVTVASIQSIKNIDIGKVNLIILDEAHNVSIKENSSYCSFLKKVDHERLKIIGFTATPYRESTPIYGKGKFFECIDHEIRIEYMLAHNYLVRPVMKASKVEFDTTKLNIVAGDFDKKQIKELTEDEAKATVQVNDAIPRLEGRKKIAWACASIRHCEIIYKLLPDSVIIHSEMTDDDQDKSMDAFINGDARHIVFVSMLSEGIDIPKIDALVFLRPTRSIVRYIQTVGRALRLSEGKSEALILDYGQVVKNCGPINAPFIRKGNERKRDLDKMKVCPSCMSILERKHTICPDCQHEFIKKPYAPPRLTDKPEFATDIFGKSKPITLDCKMVKMTKHLSKAGNECIKITYYSTDLLQKPVSEYFSKNHKSREKELVKRLMSLGCDFYANIDEQVKAQIKNIPSQVIYTFDGKYETIQSVVFDGRRN